MASSVVEGRAQLVTPDELAASLAKSIDPTLAGQLISEVVSLEEAFSLRRWKNTELDGGRFAEVAARILYSVDSGNQTLTKGVDDCLKYIDNNQVPHHSKNFQSTIHLSKILKAIYKLRSQRGAVHVSANYTANEIDSRLILESVRWCLAELLRVFGGFTQAELTEIVRSLSRFPQPLMRLYGEQAFLQSTSFTTEEEILAHLLFADEGMTTKQLTAVIPKDPSGVRRSLAKLATAKVRQIVVKDGLFRITDLGIKRVEAKIDATRDQ